MFLFGEDYKKGLDAAALKRFIRLSPMIHTDKNTLPEMEELLNMLYQDGEAKYLSRLVPKCWQPENFFSVPEHQNLWHSAQQRQN